MKAVFKPTTTIGPGEAALRIGLGSLLCAHVAADLPSQRARNKYHVLIDTAEDLQLAAKGVEDINFWPMLVAKVYSRADAPVTEHDIVFSNEDLYRDTVVFSLRDNLPQAGVNDIMGPGNHVLEQVLLAFISNNKTVWFSCGQDADPKMELDDERLEQIFTAQAKLGPAYIKILTEQYHAMVSNLPELDSEGEWAEKDHEQLYLIKWMIANALVANHSLTEASVNA